MTGGAWYDQPARSYGLGLLWKADRCMEIAQRRRQERKAWSLIDAEAAEHDAVRLRAMAKLCSAAPAGTRAGDVDFRGLTRPDLGEEREAEIIAQIEQEHPDHG